jgi:hypothetical protein
MKGLACLKSARWWNKAGTRALKTCAQTAVALIGTSVVVHEVSWLYVASGVAMAGILSMLTSLGGIPEAEDTGGIGGTD